MATNFAASFTVPGQPVPQPRPKTTVVTDRRGNPVRGKNGRFVTRTYYPDPKGRLKAWKEAIALFGKRSGFHPLVALTGPIVLTCIFHLRRPKREAKREVEPHLRRPDWSNMYKVVEDVLKDEGWFVDDSQVWSPGDSRKVWCAPGEEPRCEVTIEERGL